MGDISLNRTSNGRIEWIDIAKGIAIFLVVIGHCIPDAASPTGISVPGYRMLHDVIYSFHMPLFFFLAGYLVVRKKILDSGKKWVDIIITRMHRLLIPYLFVGLIYAPFKLLLSRFANKPYDFENIWQMVIGVNPDGELWFLYSLFVITVIAAIFSFRISLSGLLAAGVILIWNPWTIVTNYLFFFLLGIYMRREHCDFIEQLRGYHIILAMIIFLLGNYGLIIWKLHLFFLLTALSGMTIVFWGSYQASKLNLPGKDFLAHCGIMSMDIYILSDIIKIPFRIVLWNKLHLYTISFLVCTIMSIGLSLVVSRYIVRKYRVLRCLILGM